MRLVRASRSGSGSRGEMDIGCTPGQSGLRSLQDCVEQIVIQFVDFVALGTLDFYFAAFVVVARQRVGPDDLKIVFAIDAHERAVAWHWNSCILDLNWQEKRQQDSTLF